jgi:hypothetical protein
LAATTTVWVKPEELKDMESLRYLISKSLGTAKWWWENECSEGYRNQ